MEGNPKASACQDPSYNGVPAEMGSQPRGAREPPVPGGQMGPGPGLRIPVGSEARTGDVGPEEPPAPEGQL